MSQQEYAAGFILAVVVFALPLTLLISWGLLRLYRRSVIRLMETRSMIERPPALEEEKQKLHPTPQERPGINITTHKTRFWQTHAGEEFYKIVSLAPWRTALIYGIGWVSYALLLAGGFLASGKFAIQLLPLAHLFWVYLWFVVPILWVMIRRGRLAVIGFYVVGFVFLGLTSASVQPTFTWEMLLLLWTSINLWPTIELFLVLNRRVRAVGSLVLVFTIFAAIGIQALVLGIGGNSPAIIQWGIALGMKLWQLDLLSFGVFLVGLAIFVLIGWLAMKRIRHGYEHKKISDQSLVVDTIWLLFLLSYMILFSHGGTWWAILPAGAFLVSKLLVALGFWLLRRTRPGQHKPVDLLLLRVFSLGRRSEHFYDTLSAYWRQVGNIRMIAGPDLATSTIEPHEFLDYLTGRISNRFIDSAETLERRIAEVDEKPDFDGRYRVSEFFCYADTWKMVLARLAEMHDAVLMDVRGFSSGNTGCIFEINALIDLIPLNKVVFVIDETTDEGFLRQIFEQAWGGMDIDSPNRTTTSNLCLFRFEGKNLRGFSILLRLLCSAVLKESQPA